MAGQRPDHTLQTTALVNEAYLRLAGQDEPSFANRSHFLAVAAKAMRQILVDHARSTSREKRGAGAKAVELDEAALLSPEPTQEILDLNEALEKLAALDARKANVVELKLLRRPQAGRDRRSAERLGRDRAARLDLLAGVAVRGTAQGGLNVDPARLQAIEAIFHAALDVETGRLEEFLDERCAGDASLRRDVESLLAAHRQTGSFIDTPIATLDEKLFDDEEAPDQLVGQTVGHWEILKRIGSGGMGAVYLARRADRQYEQQVALKLIKRGMDTEAMLRRFRNERQILAGFDHPNIARLLDGDTTDDGLPYFVMEYVEGLPIDEYCDLQALDVTGRLQLFRQVCAAVSYAHRRAVIHRDLKCSNILVGSDGVPKLLDFGIARLLQAGDAAESPVTMLEQRVMTPEYASPEHLLGAPVTTASDVYSLGVVLYRLLTGQLPHRLKAQSAEDMARTVGQTEPQRPSAVVETTSSRRLRGDLDNIVLMALRKEPERRYTSVEEFSEDIGRHLERRPVQARPDTLAYRAGKFVRRNTGVSVAATLVVLSLVGGIVMTSWQAQRAREQEAIAIAEKARAERRFNEVRQLARSVLFDYHDAIENLSGATAIRERLVNDGLAYLDSLAGEASDDPELQRELAAAYDRVGDVRGKAYSAANLGDFAGARESYDQSAANSRSSGGCVPWRPADPARTGLQLSEDRLQLLETSEAARGMEYLRKGARRPGAARRGTCRMNAGDPAGAGRRVQLARAGVGRTLAIPPRRR